MQLNRRIISTLLYHNLKNLLWYCTLYSPILVGKRETYTHTQCVHTHIEEMEDLTDDSRSRLWPCIISVDES